MGENDRVTEMKGGLAVAWTMWATAVLVALPGGAAPAESVEGAQAAPSRILIVGDSTAHGSSGDFTWRYFLDRHLTSSGSEVDFVGPRDHLYDIESYGTLPSYEYADPDFDADHGAQWGDSMAWPYNPLGPLMHMEQPDVVVHGLGANDLRFWSLGPERVISLTEERVAQARSLNPDVMSVLVQVFAEDEHVADAEAYNVLLARAAEELSTPQSPVVVALADETYTTSLPGRPADTWDDIHPDTSGQVKHAAAVADALSELGIGERYPRPLIVPVEGLRRPSHLDEAIPGEGGVVLTWTAAPGATTHDIWIDDVSPGAASSRRVIEQVGGTTASVGGLEPGHEYSVRVLARKHLQVSSPDMVSNTLRVRVPGGPTPLVDVPETLSPTPSPTSSATPSPSVSQAPAPTGDQLSLPQVVSGVAARARRDAVQLTWNALPTADSYLVWVRDVRAGAGWDSHRTSDAAIEVTGLRSGAQHWFRVQVVGQAGVGPASVTLHATPKGPRPAAPRRIAVGHNGASPVLTWRAVRHATHYQVAYRPAVRGARWSVLPEAAPANVRQLPLPDLPRVAYVFRVRPFHDLVAGRTARVRYSPR